MSLRTDCLVVDGEGEDAGVGADDGGFMLLVVVTAVPVADNDEFDVNAAAGLPLPTPVPTPLSPSIFFLLLTLFGFVDCVSPIPLKIGRCMYQASLLYKVHPFASSRGADRSSGDCSCHWPSEETRVLILLIAFIVVLLTFVSCLSNLLLVLSNSVENLLDPIPFAS